MTARGTDHPRWSHDGGIHEIPLPVGVAGRMWLCGKHHIANDVDSVIDRVDATVVVCLTRREELHDRYPGYVRWLDDEIGRRAIWFPIHDLGAPPLEAIGALFDDLGRRLRSGETLVIHCAAGIGRAGTVAVAVLMLLGVDLDDALDTVRANRPMAGPEVGAQRDLLIELADRLATG